VQYLPSNVQVSLSGPTPPNRTITPCAASYAADAPARAVGGVVEPEGTGVERSTWEPMTSVAMSATASTTATSARSAGWPARGRGAATAARTDRARRPGGTGVA